MKKVLGLFVALSIFSTSFGSGSASVLPSNKPAKINASEVFIPIGKNGQKISLLDLSKIRVKEFETISGRKMKFSDKVKFRLGQKQLSNSINSDNTIDAKKLGSLKPGKKATEKSRQYLRIWLVLLAAAIILSILGIFVGFLWIIGLIASLGALIFFILWLIELSKG